MPNPLPLLFTFLFITQVVHAQPASREIFRARYHGGLCSATIWLCNDSTYYKEEGCEGSSYISYGRWIGKEDTIFFRPIDYKSFQFVKQLSTKQEPGDSVRVAVFDKNDENITWRIAFGLYVRGIGVYPVKLNADSTEAVTYKRRHGQLYLKTLENICRQPFTYKADSINNFVIRLNIPKQLISPGSEWEEPYGFEVIKKDDVLLSLLPPGLSPDMYGPVRYERLDK